MSENFIPPYKKKFDSGSGDALAHAPTYIPTDEALKFIAFIRAGGLEENISPVAHYQIADALFSSDKADWNVVIECMRGLGKSTLAEYVFIYVSALGYWPGFGKAPFWVFLGASQEGNVKMWGKNIASKVENSPFFSSILTVIRQTDTEVELRNTDGYETMCAGRGMNTNWRGIRSRTGDRPSILLADDVLPNDVMTSETIRKTIETNWFNSALPAIHPTRHKIIYIGTPLSEADLLHKLKRSGAYRIVQFPLCEKFPVAEEDFVSIWPDRFTYEYTLKMYNQFKEAGKTQSFYTEYLLQVVDLTTLLVDEEDIRYFDPDIVRRNIHRYSVYISTDFAVSTKQSADFSAIAVWAISSASDWMLIDGQCKRQSMQDNLDDLFRYCRIYNPLGVGIETSGQQQGFLSIIDDMSIRTNTYIPLARKRGSKEIGIRPDTNKTRRFVRGVQPKFEQRKVWLPKPDTLRRSETDYLTAVQELQAELAILTLAGGTEALPHDDMIDTMNQLSEIDVIPGNDSAVDMDAVRHNRDDENSEWGYDPTMDIDNDMDDNIGSTIF